VKKTGYIVFAHGSRVESANEAIRIVARDLSRSLAPHPVLAAFLELGDPSLETAADQLAARAVERIVVLPYFLTLGLHMERDLPPILANISNAHNGLEVIATPPLDGHPALIQILTDRARSLDT
jgi:sirohydrochlorin ferrochelatase